MQDINTKSKFFQVIKKPTDELLDILNNNIIGTPGEGMLYQHLGVLNKIDKISDPYYVNLSRNNKILGTCCFCRRSTSNAGLDIQSFYIRYFSFKDKFRRKQISAKTNNSPNRLLREEIKSLLSGSGLKVDNEKFFHYAYVDPRNLRSVTLCNEFGFEPVRQFTTLIFNRVKPKEDKRVTAILPAQESVVREILRNFYKDYNMFSFENLFNGRNYYVIKNKKDKIVAGVSVNPEHWKIHSMPGITGKVILNTFSYLPVLKKLFCKDYHFLTLEGIYCSPGYEKELETLIESLLAKYKVNSAMIWIDANTSLYTTLKNINLGLVDKLNKEVRANVICKFINFSEKEKEIFKLNPSYISGIDLT